MDDGEGALCLHMLFTQPWPHDPDVRRAFMFTVKHKGSHGIPQSPPRGVKDLRSDRYNGGGVNTDGLPSFRAPIGAES